LGFLQSFFEKLFKNKPKAVNQELAFGQWSERQEQEKALTAHLMQNPDSFFLVSGPRGFQLN
jgi:hypothetical protein